MLRYSSLGIALFINFIIICLWHFLSYVITEHLPLKYADYKKLPYRIRSFERKGDFYTENFKIDLWYSKLPERYNKMGITADMLKTKSSLTIKEYLSITCRSELRSIINCFFIICAVILDAPYLAFILGCIVILINLPFTAGSRYCRILILNELVNKRRELRKQSILAEQTLNIYDLNIMSSNNE